MSPSRTAPALGRLALFGGAPAFAEKLHVGRPNLGDRARLMQRIEDVLDRNWLTNHGPLVATFEERIARLADVEHCVATCNGTLALELMIRAAGLTGQVIVPSFTFVATAHALQWQEIEPIFCDVDPETCTIDPRRVEELVTPKTTGIIGVHVYGRTCDVEALTEIAERRNLQLFFDASHAFGCTRGGKPVGGFGRAETFSFHATKFVNSFEGGAVVTDDGELADKIRLMKNFGFAGKDKVVYIGSNGKMPEVCAAMGLTSLDAMDEFVEVNRRNWTAYRARVDLVRGLRVLPFDERERNNWHYVVVDVDAEVAGLSRDELVRVLEHENVLARRYFYPGAHRMEPYASYQPHAGLLLPETERLTSRVMTLPTGTAIGPAEIDRIASVIEVAVAHAPAVRERLRAVETAP